MFSFSESDNRPNPQTDKRYKQIATPKTHHFVATVSGMRLWVLCFYTTVELIADQLMSRTQCPNSFKLQYKPSANMFVVFF